MRFWNLMSKSMTALNVYFWFHWKLFRKSLFMANKEITIHEEKDLAMHSTFHWKKIRPFTKHENTLYFSFSYYKFLTKTMHLVEISAHIFKEMPILQISRFRRMNQDFVGVKKFLFLARPFFITFQKQKFCSWFTNESVC